MADRRDRYLLGVLWAVVLLEAVSPVPLVLTFGAAWILLARPRWFLRLVENLYRH